MALSRRQKLFNTTRFQNIHRLEPGEIITIKQGSIRNIKAKYFVLNQAIAVLIILLMMQRDALIKAFHKRINKNKNYFLGLSGGLDLEY